MTERPATILIVDDEANNRNVLRAQLANDGYELLTAASGEEALALVDQRLPDPRRARRDDAGDQRLRPRRNPQERDAHAGDSDHHAGRPWAIATLA